ncbi:MAG TPA: Asp-tRNA(Asn)/Glu-tRNA(Gln) amidotransferase subunit GatA [Desulfobacteraceae bacterium]|nr:Asp-tRNA(Asn)/Glu-tRNA(Gln) amidotransferase subunit GatA [Deltaproteobacteria bacterium]HDI60903.1 Asp-tRNA(Asn)/Glu-tRNA(Gln) amidotransferase subunit GatA [Desulfobacteraceae bacterium]
MQLHELTVGQATKLLRRREVCAREITMAVLERIEALDERIGAYLAVTADLALAQADAADKIIASGQSGSLTGIPMALKDLICTAGVATTCGSRILEHFVPPYDATVVSRLADAGVVLVGKLNMDEFAMGSTCEHSAFRPTRNPWNPDLIPGGSSGGSAAAVSADLCLAALGSDTGGSIRQPAAHCGVVGLKPTYGRVSRYGLVAFASSLDQIGPLTKDVTDCALVLGAIAGHDPADSTSVPREVPDYTSFLQKGIQGMRLGLPREYYGLEGLDGEVAAAVRAAVARLEEMGAVTVDVSLPHTEYGVAAYYIIAPAEASSNLARYDGVKYGRRNAGASLAEMYRQTRSAGFGAEVQRRILIGTYCLSAGYYDAYYRKASQVRTLISRDFAEAFARCDVIVAPVAPTAAFAIGEKVDDPLQMYLSDIFTLPANLAGIPGMSLPCGFTADGRPIGLQLLGRPFDEGTLLRLAYNFEQATDFHLRKPVL